MHRFIRYNPVKWIFGEGSIKRMEAEAASLGKNVLLVYGGGSIKNNGVYNDVIEVLQRLEKKVTELPGVEPNPRLLTVRKGIELCRREKIDLILAAGGGSVIDTAKAIAAGALYEGDVWELIAQAGKVKEALPIGVVLTLAATGSEMNNGLVINNEETKEKIDWHSPYIFPKFAICDPAYTVSVPREQTVFGVVDTMCHIMEKYFRTSENTELQDGFSEVLLRELIQIAPLLLREPENYNYRAKLMYASTSALNGTLDLGYRGDWTSHVIEHALSGIYDIPHAGGLSILFPHWMERALASHPDRFKRFAVEVFKVEESGKSDLQIGQEGIDRLKEFWSELGAPSRLADYGIDNSCFEEVADQAMCRGEFGRFYPMNRDRVLSILQAAL